MAMAAYPESIRQLGSADVASTGLGEATHKGLKRSAKFSNRHEDSHLSQVAASGIMCGIFAVSCPLEIANLNNLAKVCGNGADREAGAEAGHGGSALQPGHAGRQEEEHRIRECPTFHCSQPLSSSICHRQSPSAASIVASLHETLSQSSQGCQIA